MKKGNKYCLLSEDKVLAEQVSELEFSVRIP